MTCFNQMWLPISLEEDLSSFERGEHIFQLLFWINHLHLCQGWLRYLCDRHLHGNVLQHHHRLGCLLLCREVSHLFQNKCLSNNSLTTDQELQFTSENDLMGRKEIKEDNIDHFDIFSILTTGEYAADNKE